MPIPQNSRPPLPHAIRSLPRRWNWVDCRLLESGLLAAMTGDEAVLYLALLCVGDRQGLSWWRDDTLGRRAGLTEESFHQAKRRLIQNGLIAWKAFHPGGTHGIWQIMDVLAAFPSRPDP
jgi:hypothetical protein